MDNYKLQYYYWLALLPRSKFIITHENILGRSSLTTFVPC